MSCTRRNMYTTILVLAMCICYPNDLVDAFSQKVSFVSKSAATSTTTATRIISNKSYMETSIVAKGLPTVEAPTREKTDRKTGGRTGNRNDDFDDDDDDDDEDFRGGDNSDLEYLMDPNALRGDDDPFHILLMGSTFEKPKITVPYVSNSLEYVLAMPFVEATELSQFAKTEGMSCLGTWKRAECLTLGKQLRLRDIVCRVVPYCEGGQRGWQAKDTFSTSGASSSD